MITAVIDIGSNSIKMLVAAGENPTEIFKMHSDTRLSPNTESARELIPENAFRAGVDAVEKMFREAQKHSATRIAIVGTSLLRTAENAPAFIDAVFRATGARVRVLSGEEEAEAVADGVMTDPAVRLPCAIFDLGGGSLEFIAKIERRGNAFEKSWKLGAVRMMRKFFSAPAEKIPPEEIRALRKFVRETTARDVAENLPAGAMPVFCGGAASICLKLAGVENSEISATDFENLLARESAKTLAERIADGIPAARADVFPAALAVFAELCAIGDFARVRHTAHNLRFGLCAKLAENNF